MVSPGLARPNQIWVYDFIADPAKVPADSYISADLSAPTTPRRPRNWKPGVGLAPSSPKAWLRISRPWVFPQCKLVRERRRKLARVYFVAIWFRLRAAAGASVL